MTSSPQFFDNSLAQEYDRWLKQIPDDPYVSRATVGIHDVLRAHFLILDYFAHETPGEGFGGVGPKSLDLLHSAVYRQFASYDGKDQWPTQFEKCATLLFGLVKNHPFHDANKRTGLLTTLLFLDQMGRVPRIRQKEFEDFVVDIADSKLEKHARFKELQKAKADNPEILFIADFLKRSTREVDHQTYTVTFHELQQILKPYGFSLSAPKGNYIDVVCTQDSAAPPPIAPLHFANGTRLAQIGFPGWKKQVNRTAIKTVRECTGLTALNGIDSKTFFQGADPVNSLIDSYAGPLKRLANR